MQPAVRDAITQAAQEAGIEPGFALAVAERESSGRPTHKAPSDLEAGHQSGDNKSRESAAKTHPMIDAAALRRILRYDPDSGQWVWLVTKSNRAPAGSQAGSLRRRGDITIRIERVEYKAHRLAWLYMTGEWPIAQIDHYDLNRANNRWTNLREANNSQNNANRRVRSDSSTGVKGVIPNNSKANPFEARIKENGRVTILGYFPTEAQASAAYLAAAKRIFGKFARAS